MIEPRFCYFGALDRAEEWPPHHITQVIQTFVKALQRNPKIVYHFFKIQHDFRFPDSSSQN